MNAARVVVILLGGLLAAFALVLAWFNIRRVGTRKRAATLPDEVCREVLARIDRAGIEDRSPVLLLRVVDGPGADAYSRINGTPVWPPGSAPQRPALDSSDTFLAQIRLQSPPLPETWSGWVVLLFSDAAGALTACSVDGSPTLPDQAADRPAAPARGIETLRLPLAEDEEEDGDDKRLVPSYRPGLLLRRIPALRQLLAGCPDNPERLLPHILVPGIATHEIDTFHVCLMGGEPELIQSEHAAWCRRCSQPMRFLFQLGDVLRLRGDAPVVYVYGCDAHRDEVKAYIDTH
jgi:hypothetical protein